MIRYKIDVVAALKDAGYSSYRILREGTINNVALQKLRHGKLISWEQFNRVCKALNCQPGELIEYIEDSGPEE